MPAGRAPPQGQRLRRSGRSKPLAAASPAISLQRRARASGRAATKWDLSSPTLFPAIPMHRGGSAAIGVPASICGRRPAISSRAPASPPARYTCASFARSITRSCFIHTGATVRPREGWLQRSEAREIRRLEEEGARRATIAVEFHFLVMGAVKRPVSRVDDRAWCELVGCEEIGQHAFL